MEAAYKIAVVGLGAVGAAATLRLAERLAQTSPGKRFEIRCYEPSKEVGPGLAYSTKQRAHILNMRASTMSLFPERPDDFVQWLAAQGQAAADNEYVSRALFGRYVRQRFEEAVAASAHTDIEISVRHDEVLDCEEGEDGVRLATRHGEDEYFNYVLLALGHLPESQASRARFDTSRYINTPWRPACLQAIESDARVGVLGSSLTAVDVILSLEENGFRGPIYCVSRRRVLPKVQSVAPQIQLRHLTREALFERTRQLTRKLSLSDVLELLKRDFLEFENGEELWRLMFDDPADDAVADLEDSLARAADGKVVWHTILEATSNVIADVWASLEEKAKGPFQRVFESSWAMFRHSMPAPNARRLLAIAREGRLHARSGLEGVQFHAERNVFELDLFGKQGSRKIEVDYLIDASGTLLELSRIHSPLLRRMLWRGQLRKHPFGGVDVDFESSRLRFANDSLARRIAFVGIQTKGVHFYTNAFDQNRDRAFAAVESLLATAKQACSARQAGLEA